MKKFLLALAAILSSGWSIPVTFGLSCWIIAAAHCALEGCRKTYTSDDIPRFNCTETRIGECEKKYGSARKKDDYLKEDRIPVAVYLPSEAHRVQTIRLTSWPDVKLQNPDASLMIPAKRENGGLYGSIVSSTPTSQTIMLYDGGDFSQTRFIYETDGTTIKPIKYESVKNFGAFWTVISASICLCFAIRHIALWWRRRLYRAVPA